MSRRPLTLDDLKSRIAAVKSPRLRNSIVRSNSVPSTDDHEFPRHEDGTALDPTLKGNSMSSDEMPFHSSTRRTMEGKGDKSTEDWRLVDKVAKFIPLESALNLVRRRVSSTDQTQAAATTSDDNMIYTGVAENAWNHMTRALEDTLPFQLKPVFMDYTRQAAHEQIAAEWDSSLLYAGYVNVRKDGWGTWRLYKCVLSPWYVLFYDSAAGKAFASTPRGRISLQQIDSIIPPSKSSGWQECTISLKAAWTSYEVCAPDEAQAAAWLSKLKYTVFEQLQLNLTDHAQKSCSQKSILICSDALANVQRDRKSRFRRRRGSSNNGIGYETLNELHTVDDDDTMSSVQSITIGKSRLQGKLLRRVDQKFTPLDSGFVLDLTCFNPPIGEFIACLHVSWQAPLMVKLAPDDIVHVWLNSDIVFRISPSQKSQATCLSSITYQPLPHPQPLLNFTLQCSPNNEIDASDWKGNFPFPTVVLLCFGVLICILRLIVSGWSASFIGASLATLVISRLAVGGHFFAPILNLNKSQRGRHEDYVLTLFGIENPEATVDGTSTGLLTEQDVYKNQLAQMAERFPDSSKAVLWRFLKAREYNVQLATEMLDQYYVWRRAQGELGIADILNELRMGCFYFHGRALDGTPLVVIETSRFIAKNTGIAGMTKLCVVMTELVAREFPEQPKITTIVDCRGLSLRTNIDLALFQELLKIVNSYVPEVLGRLFVVNTPVFVKGLWNFFRGLLDPNTVDKIRFLRGSNDYQQLLQFISAENLPPKYGGTSSYIHDPQDSSEASVDSPHWGVWQDLAST